MDGITQGIRHFLGRWFSADFKPYELEIDEEGLTGIKYLCELILQTDSPYKEGILYVASHYTIDFNGEFANRIKQMYQSEFNTYDPELNYNIFNVKGCEETQDIDPIVTAIERFKNIAYINYYKITKGKEWPICHVLFFLKRLYDCIASNDKYKQDNNIKKLVESIFQQNEKTTAVIANIFLLSKDIFDAMFQSIPIVELDPQIHETPKPEKESDVQPKVKPQPNKQTEHQESAKLKTLLHKDPQSKHKKLQGKVINPSVQNQNPFPQKKKTHKDPTPIVPPQSPNKLEQTPNPQPTPIVDSEQINKNKQPTPPLSHKRTWSPRNNSNSKRTQSLNFSSKNKTTEERRRISAPVTFKYHTQNHTNQVQVKEKVSKTPYLILASQSIFMGVSIFLITRVGK